MLYTKKSILIRTDIHGHARFVLAFQAWQRSHPKHCFNDWALEALEAAAAKPAITANAITVGPGAITASIRDEDIPF